MTLKDKPTVTIVDTFELIGKIFLLFCYTGVVIWITTLFCDHKPYEKEIMQLKAENAMLRDSIYSRTLLTWDNVQFWLTYFDVQQTDIVKRQIALESNYLTSRLCLEQNNLFGLKYAKSRETMAICEKNGYAYYSSFISCIKDYSLFQKKYYKGQDYYEFLTTCGYAEDTTYISKLKTLNLK